MTLSNFDRLENAAGFSKSKTKFSDCVDKCGHVESFD